MDKPVDTRNWKCFFGMHQWRVVKKIEEKIYEKESDKYPSKMRNVYILMCVHCGEMTKRNL